MTPEEPPPREFPERQGAPGSTVKTIACGKTRCRVGSEFCTRNLQSYEWVCVPTGTQTDDLVYACDDASDCAAPLTCCRSFASAGETFHCDKPTGDCAALVCAGKEPGGAKCPKGQRCDGGYCDTDSHATCGDGKQCPSEVPYCAWSSSPTCVDVDGAEKAASELEQEGAAISGVYQCTKPSDCGSYQCCTSMSYAEKLTNCFHRCDGANSMLLCTRDSDCRERAQLWCGDNAACRRAVRCVPPSPESPGATPPWMKVCRQLDY